MANFPSLIPSQRTWTPGKYPSTSFTSYDLTENRVLHSTSFSDSMLNLVFTGLSESDMLAILLHYENQLGSFLAFDLPGAIFSGVSNAANYTVNGYKWRYAETPKVEDLPCGSHDVAVTLESSFALPSGTVQSTILNIGFLFSAGNAFGNTVNGISQSISISFSAGTAEASELAIFSSIIYTGLGSTDIRSFTNLNLQPGFIWIQQRTGQSGLAGSLIFDSLRGVTGYWQPSNGSGTNNTSTGVTSFDADGFTIGGFAAINTFSRTYVARCIALASASAANTDGTIETTVQTNILAGLSIASYTGTGVANTIGHGLGNTPDLIIFRREVGSAQTLVLTPSLITDGKGLFLNLNSSVDTSPFVTAIDSSTISLAAGADFGNPSNAENTNYSLYCFRSISGKSKINTYTGQGSTATIVSCGFAPEFVMIKAITATGDWMLFDAAREPTKQLLANTVDNETTVDKITFESDGFTVKANENANTSSVSYLYMAFK